MQHKLFKDLNELIKIDYKSVSRLYQITRKLIHQNTKQRYESNDKLGGCDKIVEIDESVFARTNNQKSGYDPLKKGAKIWVLGFYERNTKL